MRYAHVMDIQNEMRIDRFLQGMSTESLHLGI